jgi:urease accessory protein
MRIGESGLMKTGLLAGGFALLAATPAFAHAGHAEHGFASGFAHPWGGLDHLLVMAAIGFAALTRSAQGGRADIIVLPAAFLVAMAAGTTLVWSGVTPAFAEIGIAASLALMALLLVGGQRVPLLAAGAVAAFAGAAHGGAHGAESSGEAGAFLAGMLIATALLHAIGLAGGYVAARGTNTLIARGAAAAALLAAFLAAAPAAFAG